MTAAAHAYTREPFLVIFKEDSAIKETYAGQLGTVVLEGHHLVPEGAAGTTVVLFMHPIGSTQYLPMIGGLAKAGVPVISCNSRYPRNDSALIMEKVCADLGAAVRHAKEKFGYERVVLGGWSGGGSLSLFFQSQAEGPTITETPAGEPYDLTAAGLVPADGIMLLAAHTSRAKTLTEWLDPSIRDELDPFDRAPSLNIFDPANPAQPPYEKAFLDRYGKAQVARNRRITEWAQTMLATAKRRGDETFEHCFVVYGTMADPRWRDTTLDPNDRKPDRCFMGDPKMVNDAPAGLARFSTLRSWLSQWSYDLSNADGPGSAARISCPVLIVENSADDGCLPHHMHRIAGAIPHDDVERHMIQGANHYYFGQPDKLAEAVAICTGWLAKKGWV